MHPGTTDGVELRSERRGQQYVRAPDNLSVALVHRGLDNPQGGWRGLLSTRVATPKSDLISRVCEASHGATPSQSSHDSRRSGTCVLV